MSDPLPQRRSFPLAFALCAAVCAALGLAGLTPPAPLPADAPVERFSAARAHQQQAVIARQAHPIGSAANAAVRDHLVAELTALGFAVEVDRGPIVSRYGKRPASVFAFVENVVARKPGREGGPALVLMSHYDGRWHAPGAGDAGSGVATILETVRALGHTPLARDLMVVLTDGEEVGLLGAQRWVATLPELADIGLLLNFEARGSNGPAFLFETSPGNGALIAAVGASVARPTALSLGYEVYQRMPNDTDFSVTKAAGIQGLNFAPVGNLFDYHSPTDTPANYDLATLQQQGEYAVALARRFGAGALPLAPRDDVVFFDLFGRVLVHFPIWLSHLLTLGAAALFGALAWRLRRRGELTGGDLARAGGWTIAMFGAVIAFGMVGAAWIDSSEQRWWASVARMGPNAFGWVLVGAGAAWVGAALATRGVAFGRLRFRAIGWWALAVAGVLPWLLAALAASWAAPTAAYTFTLPLVFALLGHHIALGMRPAAAERALLGGAVWGWTTGAALVWLLHQALGYASPTLTAVVAMLLALLALPALRRLADRHRGLLAAPLVAGLVLLLALAATPPWSERLPRPLDTFALADHDAGVVRFASSDPDRDSWQLGLVPESAEVTTLAVLAPGNQTPLWTAPAAGAALGAPPQLDARISAATGSTQLKGGRFVPPPGALAGSIWIKSDAALTRVALAGQTLALPAPNAAGWRRLRWYALPAAGVTLELEFDRDAPVELFTASLVPGFPAPFAALPLARLPATMPAHYSLGDATAVLKRFEL